MAVTYSYNDWRTYPESTRAQTQAKLDRLRLHMGEVADALAQPDVTSDGKSRSAGGLERYYEKLVEDEKRLMRRLGAGGRSVIRLNK